MKEQKHLFIGKWITSEEFSSAEPVNVFHRQLDKTDISSKTPKNSHILFRKKFVTDKTENTYIYISADDYYKLYINGEFVCQGPAPGYHFHYYYNEINISSYLKKGENVIAVHTYYQGLINRVWVSGDDRHGLILDICRDGETVVKSDESFLYSYHTGFEEMGTFGYSTQFAQTYISGTAQEDFSKIDYDDSDWKCAREREFVDYELFLQPTRMLETEIIKPEILRDKGGLTADFGAIYVGYLNASALGAKGREVELLFGQEKDENGEVKWQLRANCNYREKWVLSGKRDSLNEFDYKSFRYVRMNFDGDVEVENVTLTARHYPFELKAVPSVSDAKLLKIWDLCVNSLKYGAQEVIQDCMEREKGNYLGDGCYTALAYTILTGDGALFKKLIDDSLRSKFINGGLMTCACCSFMQEIAEYPLMMYYSVYSYYKLTGDSEYLKKIYPDLCSVLDYYRDTYLSEDNLLVNLDKWCVVEWPSEYRDGYTADIEEGKVCKDIHNVINAHFIGAVKYMNKISAVLKMPAYCDEKPFTEAYYKAFYDGERHLFCDKVGNDHISVISNVFALMYGIYDEKETEDAILKLIEEKGFTSVMLFGAFPILAGLKRIGRTDLMYKYLKDEKAWLNMLSQGATRTFEGWGKESKWNTSLFHLTLSYAAVFLTDWEKY